MMKILKKIFGRKEEIPDYPNDFAIVDYSPIALENGIKDDQNKIITRYFYDSFGNLVIKKMNYSKERVFVLKEIHHIPIFDKTQGEVRFPVYSRILPSEVEYKL